MEPCRFPTRKGLDSDARRGRRPLLRPPDRGVTPLDARAFIPIWRFSLGAHSLARARTSPRPHRRRRSTDETLPLLLWADVARAQTIGARVRDATMTRAVGGSCSGY